MTTEISDIIKKVNGLKMKKTKLEEQLGTVDDELRHYIETVLPDLFTQENMTKATIDKYNLTLSKTYFVSFENQEMAMDWFKEQGLQHIFKRDVIVHCMNEEYKELLCNQLGLSEYDYKVSHHWKTMSSQIRDLIEKDIDIPEYIKVSEVSKVHINEAK